MEKVPLLLATALAAAALLAACRPKAAPPPNGDAATASAPSAALSGAKAVTAVQKDPIAREGGTLARAPGGDALYVADEDHGVVRVVPLPLDPSRPRLDVKVPGAPAAVLPLSDRVLVTVRDPGLLLVMKPDPATGLVEVARVALPADAWGVAVAADEAIAVVTSAWTHQVSAVDLRAQKKLWSVDVAREPRGVVLTKDSKRAYITHLIGSALTRIEGLEGAPNVTRVPLPVSRLRARPKTPDDATLGYAAALSPDGARLFVPRQALNAEGKRPWNGQATVDVMLMSDESPFAEPASGPVRFQSPGVDEAIQQGTGRGPFMDLTFTGGIPQREIPFASPRTVIYRRSTRTLLVASEGTDALVELDALAVEPAGVPLHSYDLGLPRKLPEKGEVLGIVTHDQRDNSYDVMLEDGTMTTGYNRTPIDRRLMVGDRVGIELAKEKGKLGSIKELLRRPRKPGASVCGAPSGVALSSDEATAWVFCRSTDGLAAVPLEAFEGKPGFLEAPLMIVKLGDDPLPEPAATGRRIFYDAGDPTLSGGMACAGCHPEGRDDGHVWREARSDKGDLDEGGKNEGDEHSDLYLSFPIELPGGFLSSVGLITGEPRQTPMLAGRVAAQGPYGWHGRSPDLVSRIIRGSQLHHWHTIADAGDGINHIEVEGTSKERAVALAAFVRTGLVPPPRAERSLTAEEERGKAVFLDPKTACATCHVPASAYTDRSVVQMRAPKTVFTKAGPVNASTEANRWFKTPSLLFVGGTPPYFHDGSLATLEDVIDKNDDRMGKTNHLSPEDRAALVAFLRTL